MVTSAKDLGRRFVVEQRSEDFEGMMSPAAEHLRDGAGGLTDDDLWTAVVAALAEARDDSEYWLIGDGVVDESVRIRPVLARRMWLLRESDPAIASLFRVMQDPRHNWTNADWWAVRGEWLGADDADDPLYREAKAEMVRVEEERSARLREAESDPDAFFAERGIVVRIHGDNTLYWADLFSADSDRPAWARYGRGDTPEGATYAAVVRWLGQEASDLERRPVDPLL